MANPLTAEQKKKRAISTKKYRGKRAEWLIAQKSKPCADCDNRYPFYCMDFDHVRGVKEFGIADSQWSWKSIAQLEVEIAKCELVCANCHRIRTYERTGEENG